MPVLVGGGDVQNEAFEFGEVGYWEGEDPAEEVGDEAVDESEDVGVEDFVGHGCDYCGGGVLRRSVGCVVQKYRL